MVNTDGELSTVTRSATVVPMPRLHKIVCLSERYRPQVHLFNAPPLASNFLRISRRVLISRSTRLFLFPAK